LNPNTNNKKCPACLSSNAKREGEKNGYEILFCRRCSTLYTSGNDAGPTIYDYEDYYHERNTTTPEIVARRLDETISEFASFNKNNRLLDVGCGSGALLEAAKRAGWNAEGIEVSRSSIEHVHSLGFKVFHGTLEEARFDNGVFDVVTAVELLEHVPQPRELIKEIARVLRAGGLFWATTPNGKGVSARLLGSRWSMVAPPEHLHLFSAKGLRLILKEAGFRQINIDTLGVNPFEILHAMRSKQVDQAAPQEEKGFDRVGTAYQLNSFFDESLTRRALKSAINKTLNLTRLGDSLKVWARK
jgi:SAM-dependent methyltransferase